MATAVNRDYFWALAAAGVAAIAALTLGLIAFAHQSDTEAKAREETVIGNGLNARIREIESQVLPQAIWDDAVRNLDNRFSRQWASDNVGNFLHSVSGFGFALVIDADDHVQYAMRDGTDIALSEAGAERAAAATVIATVRAAEREERTVGLENAVQSSAIHWVNDRLYVVTATLVQPDFGRARVRRPFAPIILTGRELDAAFLEAFGERYLLDNLHLHDGDAGAEPGDAHSRLLDEDGVGIATLDWSPRRPGWSLLVGILPALLTLLATMLGATLALYVRARKTRRNLEQSEKTSAFLARHDALTSLPNRMRFEELLMDAVIRSAKTKDPFAILCIDLDRFKEINDAFGHHIGDEALQMAAAAIASRISDDATCARLDGDGFAVLLRSGVTELAAAQIAESILSLFERPLELRVGPRLLGCSIGVVVSGADLFEPLEMLRRADLALFRAKSEGRGCYRIFDDAMDRELKTLRMLRDDLRADIAASRLTMVYQPQVRLSGEVVGVEALVRWTHATMGTVSPSTFVPLAEEAGSIHALGDFTLRQAATDGLRWPGVKTAVNVSATQLQSPGYVERVKAIVAEVGAHPNDIEIELTEGVLFSNEQQVYNALMALHDAGFSIALDDFGTGYSSLSYLPKFPIDKIKIDRSFVMELGHDKKSDALFSVIVHLAQTLGMRVIAEGVETQEQWLRLSAAGCPKVQGFIASKPLPASEAEVYIRTHVVTPDYCEARSAS